MSPLPPVSPLPPELEPDLLELLACPGCRQGALSSTEPKAGNGALACGLCGARYPIRDGIPVLLGSPSSERELRQAAYFDHDQADEFEITRPHGTPALYGWLLGEKFRRGVSELAPMLPGSTVLTVCGGPGMDAAFLARSGARVISCDISLGAASRARERARRFGVPIASVVGDAAHLPFADRSVDLVYVHDGLHHLERPGDGLAEMARVASRAVSVNEPARAAATALAVRLGLALEFEEAGNRVARLAPDEIAAELRSHGFRVLRAERYGMYYRHEPGRAARALSRRALLPLARRGLEAANRVAGPLGNKLTVQALRGDGAPGR